MQNDLVDWNHSSNKQELENHQKRPKKWRNTQKPLYYDGMHRTTIPGHKFQANMHNFGKRSECILPRWNTSYYDGSMLDIVALWH
jgi:hypothetical protein